MDIYGAGQHRGKNTFFFLKVYQMSDGDNFH